MKIHIKVLPLDWWMTSHGADETLKYYTPAAPYFKRPGIYYSVMGSSRLCWFELPDGRAFAYKPESFEYELHTLDAWQQLNHRQVEALQAVVREKVADRWQRNLLRYWRDAASIRETYRSAHRRILSTPELRAIYRQAL